MNSPTIMPGAVRIRAKPDDEREHLEAIVARGPNTRGYARALDRLEGRPLIGTDCVCEVQQADGVWVELPYVTSVSITIDPNEHCRATIGVLVNELDITASSESVRRVTVGDEPVDAIDEELAQRFGRAVHGVPCA